MNETTTTTIYTLSLHDALPICQEDQLEIDIGRGKKGRRAYGFDDIAIVPSRRTRDPDDIDISWTLGPYHFDLPRSEEHTSELQSHVNLVCRLLLEKKKSIPISI